MITHPPILKSSVAARKFKKLPIWEQPLCIANVRPQSLPLDFHKCSSCESITGNSAVVCIHEPYDVGLRAATSSAKCATSADRCCSSTGHRRNWPTSQVPLENNS